MQLVPNQFPPMKPESFRLAVIGDAPSKDDAAEGAPFRGAAGNMVKAILHGMHANPAQCFFGNVSQVPIPNRFKAPAMSSPEFQHGFNQLLHDLAEFKPNCIFGLGKLTLKALGEPRSLDSLRGSLFISPTTGYKTVCSFHPADCFRNYAWTFFLRYDSFRARQEAASPSLDLPQRNVRVGLQLGDVLSYLMYILQRKPDIRLAFDVEGWPERRGITCLSLFENPYDGLVIPFYKMNGDSYWSLEEEVHIWELLNQVLSDPDIKKIAQNAMYELFVFAWSHKLIVRGIHDDTMLKHWEMFNEMDKNLGVQASIYTREPYWKDERKVTDDMTHWNYNGKDSAVTAEINDVLEVQLAKQPTQYRHYRFNVSMLKPYTYLTLKGCRIDREKLAAHQERLVSEIMTQQQLVNDITGRNFNVKSNPQKLKYLYDDKGFPVQLHAVSKKPTGDEDALLNIYGITHDEDLLEVIKLVRLRTQFSDSYKLLPFPDGRIRCSYNLVGTDTGRLSSSETSVYGVEQMPKWVFKKNDFELRYGAKKYRYGTNLQNQAKWIRDVFIPDEGFDFFQLDLAGADAWTVAYDLASLGHSAMLEDLKYGIKPSKVILLMMEHGLVVNTWSQEKIKQMQATVDADGPMYLCAKRVQHGTNYDMAAKRIIILVRKDSARADLSNIINLPIKVADTMQSMYKARYKPDVRINYIRDLLGKQGYLDSAAGTRRKFITTLRSRAAPDAQTVRNALAQEPQANTTYATNCALHKLYYGKANRRSDGSLWVEPTLMVHDALGGQFPKSCRPECLEILRESFQNELTVQGQSFIIPADGGYGPSWKSLPNEI